MKKITVLLVTASLLVMLAACGKETEETPKEPDKIASKKQSSTEETPKAPKTEETDSPEKETAGGHDEKSTEEAQTWRGITFRMADVFEKQETDYISYRAGKTAHFTIRAYYDKTSTLHDYYAVPWEGYATETLHEGMHDINGHEVFGGQYNTKDGHKFTRFIYQVDNMYYDVVYFASLDEYSTYLSHIKQTMDSISFDRSFTKSGK